jgi:hypothetical protein
MSTIFYTQNIIRLTEKGIPGFLSTVSRPQEPIGLISVMHLTYLDV